MANSIEKIILKLEEQIRLEETLDNNLNETSWGYQLGILISVNDAKIILDKIKNHGS